MDPPLKGRVVLWCDPGANQKALAHKLASRFELAGIVVEARRPRRKILSPRTLNRILSRLLAPEVDRSWRRLLDRYEARFPQFPATRTMTVENVNQPETKTFTLSAEGDLVAVSGTRLVREPLLSVPLKIGIVNLHTGLSPYVKGGPNCTNWCLAEGTYHLIGNTVMWIDAGIDTGRLITSAPVAFTGDEGLDEIHWKVMEEAHSLYGDAIGTLFTEPGARPSVDQSTLGAGKTYYTRSWGWRERRRLLNNLGSGHFRDTVLSGAFAEARSRLRTIPLPTAGDA